jgi:hypothetical protein
MAQLLSLKQILGLNEGCFNILLMRIGIQRVKCVLCKTSKLRFTYLLLLLRQRPLSSVCTCDNNKFQVSKNVQLIIMS